MSETREQIERTADRIRDEFLITLQELDRRRHQVTDLRYQLQTHREAILVVTLGATALVGLGVGISALRKRAHRQRVVKRRLEGLLRAWEHPERVATRARERPLAVSVGRKLTASFLIAVGSRLARRFAASLVPRQSAALGPKQLFQ